MNREIKFRGLKDDMSNCNWVYGCLVYDASGAPRITNVDASGEGLTFNTCILGTVGQYVGLTDKNGKEAYVGNIYKETLLSGEERYYKIWVEKGGFVINQFQDDFYKETDKIQFWQGLSDQQTAGWFESCLEEIGNIHENPELL